MTLSSKLSLYLHIPFCHRRCSYCDFNTYTTLGHLQERYARALSQEIRQVGQLGAWGRPKRPVHTVFFGGGTPSLMPATALAQILRAVADAFDLSPDAEISLEANPGTVDKAYLEALRGLGVNRLSLGAQSAIPGELALLGRRHDLDAVIVSVETAGEVGFDNLSLDLIYGLPGQTLASWEQSLRAALALAPTHLSLYCLTVEPGTSLQRWLKDGRIPDPDPDLAADQYELACELLAKEGFDHYEVSNWALPGYQCLHNLTYWRNQEYLGLGAGAHGHATGYRYEVVKQPRVYMRRLREGEPGQFPLSAAVAKKHVVDRAEAMSDVIIAQLRLLQEGVDLDAFAAAFGQTVEEAYGDTVRQLVEWGLLWTIDGRLRLTKRGRFLSNQVFYRFV